MDFQAQLRILRAAQADPSGLAFAQIDLTLAEHSETVRSELKRALQIAAIPHWCDAAILARLSGASEEQAHGWIAALRRLTVVETFRARGDHAINVHEATRLTLRRRFAEVEPDAFRQVSRVAAEYFLTNTTPVGQIEWIYHRLGAEPDAAAAELQRLYFSWSGAQRPESFQALASAMRELEKNQFLSGRARVWARLAILSPRILRAELSELKLDATELLHLAEQSADLVAQAEARCLLGDVLRTQHNGDAAQEEFQRYLKLALRMTVEHPGDHVWLRQLAVAHSRVGGVHQDRLELAAAKAAYAQCLTLSQRLVREDPDNIGLARNVAGTHCLMGSVLEQEEKFGEAQMSFWSYMVICEQVAAKDPHNLDWQRDVAVSYSRMSGVLEAQDQLDDAETMNQRDLAISRQVVEQDPSNAGWMRDLAIAYSRTAGLKYRRKMYGAAVVDLLESLRLLDEVIARFPENASWVADRKAIANFMDQCRAKPDGAE